MGSNPVPILRCFPDTVMAAARPDTKMGSYTVVVLRSGPAAYLGFLMLRSRDLLRLRRESYITPFFVATWTAVERTHSLLCACAFHTDGFC